MEKIKEQLLKTIAPDVQQIDQAMKEDLELSTRGYDPLLKEILLYGIFNGGKRLRPLLVLLAAKLTSINKTILSQKQLLQLAIAFEYLHGATLFHDDVIDQADMRRGKPSVVKQFGTIAAILGGDFLHSRSMFLVGSIAGSDALQVLCQATNAMVDGEFLQLRNARNYNLNENDYFDAVRGKTALLIAATCEIGAMAAGAGERECKVLADFGLGLGSAFQIIDDLLDYQGESGSTGKTVGNDFQEGKMTLPVILALYNAQETDKKRLLHLLGLRSGESGDFAEAYTLIEKYNGFQESRIKAEMIIDQALDGLQLFADAHQAKESIEILHALAKYVLVRKK